jgi:hypothetical protein
MRRFKTLVAATVVAALSATTAQARCTKLAFSVNDYGKDGPTRDAKSGLDTYVAKWAAERGIKKYTTGKKDVSCELYLDVGIFDEHTCKAEALVCWDGTATSGAPKTAAAPGAAASPASATPAKTAPLKATPVKAAPAPAKTGAVPVTPSIAMPTPPAMPSPTSVALPSVAAPLTTGSLPAAAPVVPAASTPTAVVAPEAPTAPQSPSIPAAEAVKVQ